MFREINESSDPHNIYWISAFVHSQWKQTDRRLNAHKVRYIWNDVGFLVRLVKSSFKLTMIRTAASQSYMLLSPNTIDCL
jgi:hypothetical protein